MNRVGIGGRGESVWLGWFLVAAIEAFAPVASARGDETRATRWREFAAGLRVALETAGWDGAQGEWYRRGYYDDGSPLGSRDSDECRIDAIAQSWSVIAGASDAAHAARAMAAVGEHLISRDERLARLFTPPFDHTALDPGYIKGYPPGIRENGGQYTHGAIWSIFAFAKLGQGDAAADLFAMLDPIRHGSTPADVERYRVEPYAACADVYSVAPHAGRGGWTWYTGSAGWLYRAGLEAILGFRPCGDTLAIDPCIPAAWHSYAITYRRPGPGDVTTRYDIGVENPHGVSRGVTHAELDGSEADVTDGIARIPLDDDAKFHRVRIVLG
jgi:cellobiose phosphorylase